MVLCKGDNKLSQGLKININHDLNKRKREHYSFNKLFAYDEFI